MKMYLFLKDNESFVGTINFAKKGTGQIRIDPETLDWMKNTFTFGMNTRINGYLARQIQAKAERYWSHVKRSARGTVGAGYDMCVEDTGGIWMVDVG